MRKKRMLALFLSGMFVFGNVAMFQAMSQAKTLSEAEQERQRLQERQEEIDGELEELSQDQSDLLGAMEKLDKKLEKVELRIEEIDGEIEDTDKELEEVTTALTSTQEKKEAQYAVMKERIQYMYENSQDEYLEILLSSKDFSQFFNRMEYINKINAYDNEMFESFKELEATYTSQQEQVLETKSKLSVLKEEVELEQSGLEKMQKKKQERLEEYQKQIEEKSTEAEEMKKAIEEQEKEIARILLENATENGEGTVEGYIWPLSAPGRISSGFGPRSAPTAGASTFHKGMDIAAPAGTSIFAVADGKVTISTYSQSAGNYIMINHGDGVYTAYMHCSRRYVEVGDKVSQGDLIGAVGSTGISTGAHLHISFIINGIYMDPKNFLPKQD